MLQRILITFCTLSLIACQPAPSNTQVITEDALYSASLSANGQYVLLSTANNGVQLRERSSNQLKYQWVHGQNNNSDVFDTELSNNNQFAATLARDSIALWNVLSGESLGWWTLPSAAQGMALANNGHLLVGLTDGAVMSLLPKRQGLIQFLGHQEKVNSVSISDNGQWALSGDNSGKVILWEATKGQPSQEWQLPSRIANVQLSQDAKLVFASDNGGNGTIWRADTSNKVSDLAINRRQMTFSSARFINNSKQLVTGTPSKEVFLWDVSTGERLLRKQVQITKDSQNRGAVVYSVVQPKANTLVSITSQGLVETWNTKQ